MVILGFDGLEPSLVEKWKLSDLQQTSWGRTDLSDFKLLRTVSLWASFLAGRHIEDEIENRDLWDFSLPEKETFFRFFKSYKATDVPAFSYKKEPHLRERELLKNFFAEDSGDGGEIIEEYDRVCWKNHEENKIDFFEALRGDSELVFGYFALTDTIAHLSFGDEEKMRQVYEEAVKVVTEAKSLRPDDQFLIISDHGMKSVGRFGEHAPEGFWSLNKETSLQKPKISAFFELISVKDSCLQR